MFMKLDSIAAIAEIAPFYGYLDEVYRFIRRLNRRTNQMWGTIWSMLSKKIIRRKVYIECDSEKSIVEIPCKYPLILILFGTSVINIGKACEYEWLISLFERFENNKMIRITMGLTLSKNKDTKMRLNNYREYMKDTDLSFLDLYNQLIQIAISKDVNLTNIYSYAFINNISLLEDVQYIGYIVFPWNEEADEDKMIEIWNQFKEKRI